MTSENFASFIEENPLILAEFFAPWCGYCKMLGPEYSKAADSLNEYGDAVADPNSAVVKLTSENFASFIEENPLILAEFFAPWCGYCKMLGPEYSKAADSLNESHPKIKLAQIDCTEDEALCMEHGIRGYPTLKSLEMVIAKLLKTIKVQEKLLVLPIT